MASSLAYGVENPDFDPASVVAFAPDDRQDEFSYVAEHVTNDGAIGALLIPTNSFWILLVLWLLGVVSSYTLGGYIHVLLVLAVIVMLVRIIQGRNPL